MSFPDHPEPRMRRASGGVLAILALALATGPAAAEIRYVAQKQPPAVTAAPSDQAPSARPDDGALGDLVFADIDALFRFAAEHGSARIESYEDGGRYIAGEIAGLRYVIDIYNCDPACADFTFSAAFSVDAISVDQVNEWNATRRFGQAYVDDDGSAVLQYSINARFGLPAETLRDDFVWWQTILEEYAGFIGYK